MLQCSVSSSASLIYWQTVTVTDSIATFFNSQALNNLCFTHELNTMMLLAQKWHRTMTTRTRNVERIEVERHKKNETQKISSAGRTDTVQSSSECGNVLDILDFSSEYHFFTCLYQSINQSINQSIRICIAPRTNSGRRHLTM